MTPDEVRKWRPEPGRPYLKLCKDCNRRSALAGIKAEIEGVEVCLPCAAAIDQWREDFKAWLDRKRRTARNRAKAARRRARRRR